MPKFIDKTGMIFGQLTVLSRAENQNGKVYWNCKCSCGKEVVIRGDKLTEKYVDNKGNPSCGHLRIEHIKETKCKNLINQKFGRLLVLEKTNKIYSNGSCIWKCKCDCGNIIELPTDALTKKNHPTKSCGCLQKEIASNFLKELANQKMPKIGDNINGFQILDTKIEPTNNGKNESWIFTKCPFCNKEKWIQTRYVKNGDTKSCGCVNKSAGEQKIIKILIENNIPFETEKSFSDLVFTLPARFDFYIPNKHYLIEYDGEQHFTPQNFGNLSEREVKEQFLKNQEHDKIKNNYCKKKNIPLIRIPYTHYNDLCIEDLLLETSQYII